MIEDRKDIDLVVGMVCRSCSNGFSASIRDLPGGVVLKCPVCTGSYLDFVGEGELTQVAERMEDYYDNLDWEPERPPVGRQKIKL